MRLKHGGICLVFSVLVIGCSKAEQNWENDTETGAATDTATDTATNTVEDTDTLSVKACVAIRGNGPRITAHFGSLARMVEHYGLFWGAAGGSSGSISTFLIDSVQLNPYIKNCGELTCDAFEQANRASLLYKSLEGYLFFLGEAEEALSFRTISDIVTRIKTQGIEALLQGDTPLEGVEALTTLLESEDLKSLVNPDALELLKNSPTPVQHAKDIVDGTKNALSFNPTSSKIFFTPGVISFEAIAELVGRLANFYSGYGPADQEAWLEFLSSCASEGRGLEWDEVAKIEAASVTCGDLFEELVQEYRAALLADEDKYPRRIDDKIGDHLHALVTTGVLEGDAQTQYETALALYRNGQDYTFEPSFSDVGIGYWGSSLDLAAVEANAHGYTDMKTSKAVSLGTATWKEVLSVSPAEPGLTAAVEMADGQYSVGGWSDGQPVLVLKNIGCDYVIYLTRPNGEGAFIEGVTELLGITDDEWLKIFDLTSESSHRLSLTESAGRWCADWDTPPMEQIRTIISLGFNAPLETAEAYYVDGPTPYDNIESSLGLPGCTPGVGKD